MLNVAKEQSSNGTTNTTPGSCVDCNVSVSRRVRYLFKTGLWHKPLKSETTLRIPVAVAINGSVKADFAKKTVTIVAYQPFDVWVQPGQTVSLYLNSDAAPGRRTAPVFEIAPTERNVLVVVSEKRGRLGELDKPQRTGTKKDEQGQDYDEYEATLTGDTWKKVTHLFSASEAASLMPADTPAAVRDQVLSIYDGRCHGPLVVSTEQGSVRIEFEDADNPRDNITNFSLYADGLPRVHPNAWLAVIEAAIATGAKKVHTSSAWRPMLGSIAHRTGLGLDVNYLDSVHLNRQGLTAEDRKNHKARSPYVTPEEISLYDQKELADSQVKAEEAKYRALDSASKKATDDNRAALKEALEAEARRERLAVRAQRDADQAWNDERDAHQPESVISFRRYLLQCDCVSQVFDPWYIDVNTHDRMPPTPNTQHDGNEQLHATHLHITVNTPGMNV